MASDVTICNMALSHIGSSAVVTALDPPDGTAEAGHCARFYDIARAEAIEAGAWTFAKTRVALSLVANPSTVWAYAYAVPSDCLNPLRVLRLSQIYAFAGRPWPDCVSADEAGAWGERDSALFETEDGVLLTDEPDAVLLYVRDVTDPTRFSATFTTALSYLLGSYVAGPVLRGLQGAKTAQTLRQIAYGMIGRAAAQDANSSHETNEYVPGSLRGR